MRNKFWRETTKFFVRRCTVLWHRSVPALIMLMIWTRRLDPWFPVMMCTRTKSPGSSSLYWKVLSGTVPRLLREWIAQMTSQRPYFVIHLHHRTPSLSSSHHTMFWEKSITDWRSTSLQTINHHRLFEPLWLGLRTSSLSIPCLCRMEELMRRAAIYSSITDLLVACILEHIPQEHIAPRLSRSKYGFFISHPTSLCQQLWLQHLTCSWWGETWHYVSYNLRMFTKSVPGQRHFMATTLWAPMWRLLTRRSLPWGINTPFIGVWPVISRSPRSQLPWLLHSPSHLYISVWDHQSLKVTFGSHFRKGQQQKNKGGFLSGNSSTAGGNSKSVQSQRGRFNTASKKEAGSSGGTRLWRHVGGARLAGFCQPLAKPVGRVQIRPDSAVGNSFTMVGSTSSTHKNSHQFSHKKQKTGSSEGSRFSAAERGCWTRPQQSLLGVLQQSVSCAKENERSSSSNRSVHSEQVLGGTSFPDGNGSDSLGGHPPPRMDSIDRHKGCIYMFPWIYPSENISGFHVNYRTYQFTCLSFGLATSPSEFTKILRLVVQLLRKQGVRLHVYLDD